MLRAGATAPSFHLEDSATGQAVDDPWREGRTVLVFFKVTCPVCQMVGPKVAALAAGGARVVAIGQDPPAALLRYAAEHGQQVPTVSEPAPYRVSSAYGVSSVPSVFVVEPDGTVADALAGWDRDRWNAVAATVGAPPLSADGDGLPVYRPG
jgi:peroxiredoxin